MIYLRNFTLKLPLENSHKLSFKSNCTPELHRTLESQVRGREKKPCRENKFAEIAVPVNNFIVSPPVNMASRHAFYVQKQGRSKAPPATRHENPWVTKIKKLEGKIYLVNKCVDVYV